MCESFLIDFSSVLLLVVKINEPVILNSSIAAADIYGNIISVRPSGTELMFIILSTLHYNTRVDLLLYSFCR